MRSSVVRILATLFTSFDRHPIADGGVFFSAGVSLNINSFVVCVFVCVECSLKFFCTVFISYLVHINYTLYTSLILINALINDRTNE